MIQLPDRAQTDQFRDAVAQRFGLAFDESKRSFLGEVLAKQAGRTGNADTLAYIHRVLSGHTTTEETAALAEDLTVGETYFFRHPDQYRALADEVFSGHQSYPAVPRRLHILSAGCASGEEAYSLAILLREYIPTVSSCDVRVVGIDINRTTLNKAVEGRYTPWSLRGVPEALRQRVFRTAGKDHLLDASILAMVTFEERNLIDDDPGFWRVGAYDVIFCRNVLMYFTPEATRTVIARFTHALAPGGYLFLGPAETLRGVSHDYHLRHAHDAFYYQRRTLGEDATQAQPPDCTFPVLTAPDDSWITAIRRATERIARLSRETRTPVTTGAGSATPRGGNIPAEGTPSIGLLAARELIRQERYADALSALGALTDEERQDPDAQLLRAVSLTNSGQVDEAERLCHEVLARDELNAEVRYLLALCREHVRDTEAAMEQDRTAIYLDPQFAMPHLHLGLLNKRTGNRGEARRAFRSASALLPREDASRVLLFGGGFSREALLRLCEAELRASGDDS